jgi:hypothetical protein
MLWILKKTISLKNPVLLRMYWMLLGENGQCLSFIIYPEAKCGSKKLKEPWKE